MAPKSGLIEQDGVALNLRYSAFMEKTKHLAVILVKQIKGNTIIKVVTSQRKVARSSAGPFADALLLAELGGSGRFGAPASDKEAANHTY